MGRKIPAKKHRGVKDPLEQQARRVKSLQGKINMPPVDPDEQPVPRSLLRLMASTHTSAPGSSKAQGKRQRGAVGAAGSPAEGAVSRLRRLPGEPGRAFSRRIAGAVRALVAPHAQPPPDLDDEDDVRGQRMEEFRAYRRRRASRSKGAGRAAAEPAPPTRKQRLALRRTEKEARKAEAREAWPVAERPQFGERAHAPPQLALPRRAAPAHKAGGRDLLLSSLLRPKGAVGGALGASGAGAGGAAGGRGSADAERRERARLQAVAAYRALRNKTRS